MAGLRNGKVRTVSKPVQADYSGKCIYCARTIGAGQWIVKDPDGGWAHSDC